MYKLTPSQQNALNAIAARNGTGIFDKNNVLICAGDRLGFMRATYNKLKDLGLVVIDKKRITLTEAGQEHVTDRVRHNSHLIINDPDSWD